MLFNARQQDLAPVTYSCIKHSSMPSSAILHWPCNVLLRSGLYTCRLMKLSSPTMHPEGAWCSFAPYPLSFSFVPLPFCAHKCLRWLPLQCLPALSCLRTMTCVSYILYTISFPTAWNFNTLSPQGVVIVLCACGIGALCITLVMLPGDVRRAKLRAPTLNPVKHMNLLGLV